MSDIENSVTPPTEEASGPTAQERAATIQDGVYFGLPEEVYHAVPRLSASGMSSLLVSAATFWRRSWLNPRKDEDEDEKESRIVGRAYHCAFLEPDDFHDRYIRKLDRADFGDGVYNGKEIETALEALGQPKKKSGEKVGDQALRLKDAGYKGTIWALEEAAWALAAKDKTPISVKAFDQIARDFETLQSSDAIAPMLRGGQAEVSIFYTDRNGIKMKARIDYLRPERWVDLKSFDNSRDAEVDFALRSAFRYNRLYVQGAAYRDAVEAVRRGGLEVVGEATEEQRGLIAEIQLSPYELDCWFVFKEKKGVPNLLARRFPFYSVPVQAKELHIGLSSAMIAKGDDAVKRRTRLAIRADLDVNRAKRLFVEYSQIYAPGDEWLPIDPVADFEDIDFPERWLDGF